MSRNRMGSLRQVAEPDPAEIAASLLNDRPEVQWTLESLAREVHISPSQLGRVFARRYGISPMKYLTRVRCVQLATLLARSRRPVGELMHEVGWRSRGNAARQFRRITGLLPTEYRDQSQQRARPVTPLTDGHAQCPHCGQEVEIASVLMIPNAASL